jgi:hypothetical protein
MTLRTSIKDPMIVSTIIIALATVANIGISVMLWLTTQQSVQVAQESVEVTRQVFNAANRPYIGVVTIETNLNQKNRRLDYTAEIKNYGTVTANSVEIQLETFVNSQIQPQSYDPETKSGVLLPTSSVFVNDGISDPYFKAVMETGSRLQVKVSVRYFGATGVSHSYTQEYKYDPAANKFFNVSSYSS